MTQPASPPYRQIPFNALDPRTRQRVIDAIVGKTSPRPILAQKASAGGAVVGWALLACLGIAGALGLAIVEFGSPGDHPQHWGFIAGYAVAFFLVVWSLLRATRTAALSRALPFERGRYVFPTDLVIADSETGLGNLPPDLAEALGNLPSNY